MEKQNSNKKFHIAYTYNAKEIDGMIEITDLEGKVLANVDAKKVEPCFIVNYESVVINEDRSKFKRIKGQNLGFVDEATNDFGATVIAYQTNEKGDITSSALFMEDCLGASCILLSGTKSDERLYNQIAKQRKRGKYGPSYEEIYDNLQKQQIAAIVSSLAKSK